MAESPSDIMADVASISSLHQPLIVPQLVKDSSRVDVELFISEFREELGPSKWEEYRQALSHFLMGKLSRAELVIALRETIGLRGYGMRNHNTLIEALLANSYREPPPGTESSLAKWNSNLRSKSRYALNAGNDNIHHDILSLPVRERKRIKAIAKDAALYMKQPLLKPLLPSLIETRRKLLPHIPYDKDPSKSYDPSNPQKPSELNSPNPVTKAIAASKMLKEAKKDVDLAPAPQPTSSGILYDPILNLHPAHTSGPLTWKQDIVQAFDTPMASEIHELSEDSQLGQRMLGTALENGLVNGIGVGAVDVMQVGLEYYLRNILEQVVQMKHRKFSAENPIGTEDLSLFATSHPPEMGEPCGPLYRLQMNFLSDPDSVGEQPQIIGVSTDADIEPTTPTDSTDAEVTNSQDNNKETGYKNTQKRLVPLEFPVNLEPTVMNRDYFRYQREMVEKKIRQRLDEEKSKTKAQGDSKNSDASTRNKDEPLKVKIRTAHTEDFKAESKDNFNDSSKNNNDQNSHGVKSIQNSQNLQSSHSADSSNQLHTHETLDRTDGSKILSNNPNTRPTISQKIKQVEEQERAQLEKWIDPEPKEFSMLKSKVYEEQKQGISLVDELLSL